MFLNLGTHQQETDDFKKKRLEEALKLTPEQFINDPEKDIYQLFLVFIKKLYTKKYKWTTILGYIIDNEFPLNHPLVPEKGLYNILKSTPDDRMEILKVLCELQIRDHKNIRKFTKEKFDKYKISYLDLMEIYCVGNDSNENKYYYTMGPILYKIDTNNEITIVMNNN
ncbi:hypothetical protein LY90DRAFT_671325 [Neocallimastix californiae]|uniref:Uncharacterized protein n=1 Tax=Neocallimastix californiae TaxID=1754190 RepID=A0A1Y2CGR6_9FUNG|nr:hypothetical protein LY90DRAFT_671325 [Neocallimastix californiae]|eukprot:ORY46241.1 hypothetical protein LY90DRAFT_671325 [Neocallimastix californiae]